MNTVENKLNVQKVAEWIAKVESRCLGVEMVATVTPIEEEMVDEEKEQVQ